MNQSYKWLIIDDQFMEHRYHSMKGDIIMAKFISLVKYTAKCSENIKESPNRLDAFKRLCESVGATLDESPNAIQSKL